MANMRRHPSLHVAGVYNDPFFRSIEKLMHVTFVHMILDQMIHYV